VKLPKQQGEENGKENEKERDRESLTKSDVSQKEAQRLLSASSQTTASEHTEAEDEEEHEDTNRPPVIDVKVSALTTSCAHLKLRHDLDLAIQLQSKCFGRKFFFIPTSLRTFLFKKVGMRSSIFITHYLSSSLGRMSPFEFTILYRIHLAVAKLIPFEKRRKTF
jgi:hypothetical protein